MKMVKKEANVGFGAEGISLEEEVAVTFHKYVFEEEEEKGGDQTAVKGGLHFLEQVASIFQGSLEGVKGGEMIQEQGEADIELSSVLAQLDSVGFIAGGRGMMSCPSTLDRKGNSFTCSTPSRRDILCPSLDMSRVSNISTVVGKEESRVGEGWPGREESSQVREEAGRGEEEKNRPW